MTGSPLLGGAFHLNVTRREAAVARTPPGEAGFHTGVAWLAGVHGPLPILLTAAIRNRYVVPLVNPVTVSVVAVDAPSLILVQVVPLVERSIT